MMSSPRDRMRRVWPLRKPSPSPTSSNSDPTPQAIPNIVKNERILCAHKVDSDWRTISSNMRMKVYFQNEGSRRFHPRLLHYT
jgi:hypothetical protein